MNRKDFLKTMCVGSAALALSPTTLLSETPETIKENKVSIYVGFQDNSSITVYNSCRVYGCFGFATDFMYERYTEDLLMRMERLRDRLIYSKDIERDISELDTSAFYDYAQRDKNIKRLVINVNGENYISVFFNQEY